MGKECRNIHCGLELLFGEPADLTGRPMSGVLFEEHQVFSISPAYFTTPCFTLFQVPSSDRHQLDEALVQKIWLRWQTNSITKASPKPHLLWRSHSQGKRRFFTHTLWSAYPQFILNHLINLEEGIERFCRSRKWRILWVLIPSTELSNLKPARAHGTLMKPWRSAPAQIGLM